MSARAFDRYAAWYDAFNEGKDYAGEARYVLETVKRWRPQPHSWLDIGCGTGNHVAYLATRGIDVEGVDASPSMIAQARRAHPHIPFHVAEAGKFRLRGERDVVSLLFHVLSYQTSDAAVAATLGNAVAHLARDGVLVFDFWHSGGVAADAPAIRVRETSAEGRPLFRTANPTEDRARRVIDIRYEFRWDSPQGPVVHAEDHALRHFAVEELQGFLAAAGLEMLACESWMKPRQQLRPADWYGLICARRRGPA